MTVLIWSLWLACNSPTEQDGHGHSAHGHDHGEEAIQQTIWSEKLEVFVEYPPFVLGQDAEILAHITWIEKHQPLRSGSLTVHLKNAVDQEQVTVDSPARTGIFIPTFTPSKSGEFTLSLEIESDGYQEEISLGQVEVRTGQEHHGHGHAHGEEPEIVLRKEQAWKMDFQTDPAEEKSMLSSIEAIGTWKYAPQDKEQLVATTSGMVAFGERSLLSGQTVKKGEALALIHTDELTSGSLAVQWIQKKAEWSKIQAEYDRKMALRDKEILSTAQWEEVEQRYLVAKAEIDMLSRNTHGGVTPVSASSDGEILAVSVENGAFVEQGDALATMVRAAPSLIQVQVPLRYASVVSTISQIAYQVGQEWKASKVQPFTRKEVDEASQMIAVTFAVSEEEGAIEGALSTVRLIFGEEKSVTAIPISALLEEYGRFSVVEQVSGEGFALREVQIGRKDAQYVEIVSGLKEGSWVVSKGAYLVKMISLSGGVPAHGHDH